LILGLSSGTSADGVDLALIRVEGSGGDRKVEFLAGEMREMPASLRARVQAASEWGVSDLASAHYELGVFFGMAGQDFLADRGFPIQEIDFAGSHGQTVWHHDGDPAAGTLQIGAHSVTAFHLGLPVIGDFRWADLAVGGQGAPISSWADWVLHRNACPKFSILNLGGISNVSVLQGNSNPRAWDTGPANGPIDFLAEHFFQSPFDDDGHFSAQGRVSTEVVQALLADTWFDRPVPRSTGLERFGAPFAQQALSLFNKHALSATPVDIMASVTEAVAFSIANSLAKEGLSAAPVYVCGGGASNSFLCSRIAAHLDLDSLLPYSDLGWNPDLREAVAFALLADAFVQGESTTFAETTGAKKAALLGAFHPVPVLDRP
jgi:anhydro-N-acetylmuramic acid kinase